MAFEFVLPDIGEGVVEAEIQRWFVKAGDQVEEDQPLVEVMTDKATVTLPSPRRGRVTRLHFAEGQVAPVHAPLLELEVEGGAAEAAAAPTPAAASASAGSVTDTVREEVGSKAGRQRALATPAVRALAREMGIALEGVRGTGPGGRVTKEDLAQASDGHARPVNGHAAVDASPPAHPTNAGWGARGERPSLPPDQDQRPSLPPDQNAPPSLPPAPNDEILPLRGLRRRIAERMAQSKRTAVHATFVEQVDVTELCKVRDRVAAAAQAQGVKVTFLPFLVKAAVAALKKHPWLNATLDEARQEIRLRREYHIGIATSAEQGLLVPVVRNADRRSLLDVAREIERLAAGARAGRARPEELSGSTFTITSLGAQGGLFATPVINYPEVAILGVHRMRPTPVVRDGQIVAREVMNVSLSFDHRVVDGHVGAAFAYALIAYLEDPSLLFMELV